MKKTHIIYVMDRIALKYDAKQDLNGRFLEALVPYSVLLLFNWLLSIFSTIADFARNNVIAEVFTIISSIVGIIGFFLIFTLNIGISRYYLRFISNQHSNFNSIFEDYTANKGRIYWEELKAYILICAMVILGTFCFVLPGIYLALRYSQVKFVFAEHPEYTTSQALDRSKNIMEGHCWEFFCLFFSFILWYFLGAITYGIAMIYVYPYTSCAYARYYRSLCIIFDDDIENTKIW